MRQCELLDLCRSSLNYQPKPISEAELALMRRIDELHLQHPFLGARRLARMLQREGIPVGRRHMGTLMQLMGIEAIYRKPRTSTPVKGHRIYPYLLATVAIERPNQVWAADITSLPMAKGCAYLVAIMDLVDALEEALTRCGAPGLFNTDQGRQFTALDFTAPLRAKGVRVRMDGKGRWVDNVFVERLWRSVKYEDLSLHAYETVGEVKAALARYFSFYNARRPHQSLDYRTPDEMYCGTGDMKDVA